MASFTAAFFSLCLLVASPPPSLARVHRGGASRVKCPAKPLDACDFYFKGNKNSLPRISLPSDGSETSLSSPVYAARDSALKVEVDNSGANVYASPAPPGTKSNGHNAALSNVFYLTRSPSTLFARNLRNIKVAQIRGRCVILPILSAQLSKRKVLVNLNPGDEHQKAYPEKRRCVVFKTA